MKKLPKKNEKAEQHKIPDYSKLIVFEDVKTYNFLQQSRVRHLDVNQILRTAFIK